MAFRFKLTEPFDQGCRRVALEQIERAQSQLKGGKNATIAIHETRKCLKRLRALLRLIRPAIGERAYRSENTHLREIGLALAGARDRHVLIETITKLEAASGRDGLGDAIRTVLIAENGGPGDDVDAAATKQALRDLDEAAQRLAQLRIPGRGFDPIASGLEASYRTARRAYRKAYEKGADEDFHEWRKGTQQHWRHMALLLRAWPDGFSARINQARELSQLLGDDHDLAILVAFLGSEHAAAIPAETAGLIETLARERQEQLRAMAEPMGRRLFAEGAKALRRRVEIYWEAAAASDQLTAKSAKPKGNPKQVACASSEACARGPHKADLDGSGTAAGKTVRKRRPQTRGGTTKPRV